MYEYAPDQLRVLLGISLPVDVVAIANSLGYSVKYADIDSADAYITCENKRMIVVQKNMSETRQRFSIAHEIGHLMYGHNFNQLKCKDIGTSFFISEKNVFERQADEYAALLLIPEAELRSDVNKEFDLSTALYCASQKYNVSLECYLIRFVKRADFPLCVSKIDGVLVRWSIVSNSWPEEIDLDKISELSGKKRTPVRDWMNESEPEETYSIICEKNIYGNSEALLVLYTAY